MKRYLSQYLVAIILLALIGFGKNTIAGGGYDIKVHIEGLSNDTINLAYHYGSKQYIKDTIVLDENGNGAFKGDEPLPGGLYLLVLPSKNYFEFIGNEQNFSIENSTTDFVKNFKSNGSKENEVMYEDIRFVGEKGKERTTINAQYEEVNKQLKNEKDGKKKKDLQKQADDLKAKLVDLNNQVVSHRKQIVKDHPELFYADFLRAIMDVDVPENPDTTDKYFAFRYLKQHYWDNFNWKDSSLLRTPVLEQKINYYLDRMHIQHPDSLIPGVDVILDNAEANREMLRFCAITLLNKYANSKVMCLEGVYVHIVEKIYKTGKAYWSDEADVARIVNRAKKLKPALCYQTAPNIIGQNMGAEKYKALHDVDAKYTLLLIYAHDCGHCKTEIPKLMKEYKKIVDSMKVDLKVYAIPTHHYFTGEYDDKGKPVYEEDTKVQDFIEDKKMDSDGWINVTDLYLRSNFRSDYDVQSTPRVFLLDQKKKIRAKRFNSEQLIDIIDGLEKEEKQRQEEEKP